MEVEPVYDMSDHFLERELTAVPLNVLNAGHVGILCNLYLPKSTVGSLKPFRESSSRH